MRCSEFQGLSIAAICLARPPLCAKDASARKMFPLWPASLAGHFLTRSIIRLQRHGGLQDPPHGHAQHDRLCPLHWCVCVLSLSALWDRAKLNQPCVENANGEVISPFHDIPLFVNEEEGIVNMVVEIPRWSNAKFEVCVPSPTPMRAPEAKKKERDKVLTVCPFFLHCADQQGEGLQPYQAGRQEGCSPLCCQRLPPQGLHLELWCPSPGTRPLLVLQLMWSFFLFRRIDLGGPLAQGCRHQRQR